MTKWRRSCAGLLIVAAVNVPSIVGAFDIQFDYSYDSSSFFSGANFHRRAVLEAAGKVFEDRIRDQFSAIVTSGANTWSLSFPNPATGQQVTLTNPVLPQGTIVIYVGARNLPDDLLGYAEYEYSYFGSGAFLTQFRSRDTATNFDPLGGSITFDSNAAWYFDQDPKTLESFSGYDFYSLALHEIGHLLGISDGAAAFRAQSVGGNFVGLNAVGLYGRPVPLAPGNNHLAEGLAYQGQEVAMDPTLTWGTRKHFTELEFGILRDIGYLISDAPAVEPVRITKIQRSGATTQLQWTGGTGPFQVQSVTTVNSSNWVTVNATISGRAATFQSSQPVMFLRVRDLGQ